jgi:phosphoglycolate phosphatase
MTSPELTMSAWAAEALVSGRQSDEPHVVLFDLDGTLVDSLPGIVSAYKHVCTEMQLGAIESEDVRPLIGPPIQVGIQQQFGLTGSELDEGVRIFREHYAATGVLQFSKYPGIEPMLLNLRARGIKSCIATSKLRTMAVAIVEHAGWIDLIDLVGGAEADGTRHHKKDVIEWTMAQIHGRVRVIAMVGDRADDIIASRDLDLVGVGVTWGYGSVAELVDAGATTTVGSPDQLLDVLTALG